MKEAAFIRQNKPRWEEFERVVKSPREAEPDRLEDRIEQIRHTPRLQLFDAAIHRVERRAEIGNDNDARRRPGRSWTGPTRRRRTDIG